MNTRTRERVNTRTGDRPKIRRAFNVFVDQYKELKRLEFEASQNDLDTNMSVIVREALEEYLNGSKANG